ncbi:unnamed protein product [Pylaiella littoralis]
MKRAREQITKAVIEDGFPTPTPADTTGGAPAARLVNTIATTDASIPSETSASESASFPASPLAPPPAIKPFSYDPDEKDTAQQEGTSSSTPSSSSSSSSSDSSNSFGGSTENGQGGGETQRRKRVDQMEVAGWRISANAILEGKAAAGAGMRETGQGGHGISRRKFAVVCSSNVNRSIMAEILLKENNIRARSFGTGREVKLPGKDSKSPQSFPFGTPYVEIRDFLARQNEALFRRNSVLGLLERDATTKRAPERWQSLESEDVASFDVVVCFESRVFDLVVEGTFALYMDGVELCFRSQCCHVICASCIQVGFNIIGGIASVSSVRVSEAEIMVATAKGLVEEVMPRVSVLGGCGAGSVAGLPIEMYVMPTLLIRGMMDAKRPFPCHLTSPLVFLRFCAGRKPSESKRHARSFGLRRDKCACMAQFGCVFTTRRVFRNPNICQCFVRNVPCGTCA